MLTLLLLLVLPAVYSSYNVGSGIWDITGPAAEVGMMGYGQGNQTTSGIHFRLRARSVVFQDQSSKQYFAYVNLDLCFATGLMKNQVLYRLAKDLPGVYSHHNLLITATHTHSGPGGYSWYTLYDITTWGWHPTNVQSIVNGIVSAVLTAHKSARPARLFVAQGNLETPVSNANRSPTAYSNNPASERKDYKYDVDKGTVTLRIEGLDKSQIAVMNWFPVHGTSMNNWNSLISGDNKGYAMYLFERYKNGNKTLPGFGKFVAIFSNENEGDVTPNTQGAYCFDGTPCDMAHSTCNGENEACRARGPGWREDMYGFNSTSIIAHYQFLHSLNNYEKASDELLGNLKIVHQFVDMPKVVVTPPFSGKPTNVTTCPAALGDSFAAGTIDGPGDFDFVQGSNSTKDNPFWNAIAHFLSDPSPEVVKCHHPKPILLNLGGITEPTPWAPSILPIQMVRIGHLYIAAVPSELTTMSGRRLKNTIRQYLLASGAPSNLILVLSGLANEYSQYTATPEEYVVQRYEGASTLFGPNQLNAYRMLYANLATSLQKGTPVPPGPTPYDYTNDLWDLQPGVILDDGPIGTVKLQPLASYKRTEKVVVQFYSANPRNNHRNQGTFLEVSRLASNGSWEVEFVDGHWETQYHWERVGIAESLVTITWDIPSWATPGTYKITHYGDKKEIFGSITPFSGTTNSFTVL